MFGTIINFLSDVCNSKPVMVMVVMFVVGLIAEWLYPARPVPWEERRMNLIYSPIRAIYIFALKPVKVGIVVFVVKQTGIKGLFDLRFDSTGSLALSILALLVSIAITDFLYYWVHRLEHTKWLWPEHAVHHSDTGLNVTTAGRAHFLEQFLMPVLIAAPLAILFKQPIVNLTALAFIPLCWSYFLHSNIRTFEHSYWIWMLFSIVSESTISSNSPFN